VQALNVRKDRFHGGLLQVAGTYTLPGDFVSDTIKTQFLAHASLCVEARPFEIYSK